MDLVAGQPLVQLRYSIAEASSFSGSYEPQNILYNRPHDIKSRWTGAAVAAMAATAASATAASSSSATPTAGGSETSTASGTSPPTGRDGGHSGGVYTTTGRGTTTTSNTARLASAPSSTTSVGAGASDKQYIILKLQTLSVLRKIHFGKFYKPHPCNLKDFKVYGSVSTRDPHSKAWVRILRGGLKNDHVPEMFETRWTTAEGVPFPCRYVKLVPLATHLPNYNFSVWYVALEGVSDARIVSQVSSSFHEHRESVTIRLILKHLRSRAYHSAFRILLESSKLDAQSTDIVPLTGERRPFEQPMITQLFHALMQGSWDVAEICLERAAWCSDAPPSSATGSGHSDEALGRSSDVGPSAAATSASLLASYVDRAVPKPVWRQLQATDQNGDSPSGRGGHQMELDSEKGILWLYGGWDGSKDLADLWAYYIRENRWRCVSRDVRQQGGPGPRSCHKMVFDPRTGFLYVLGKYVDYDKPPSRNPSPRPGATSESGSTATRGLFLPRFPGATVPGAASSNDNSRDELFTSNRGGHMRLSARAGGAEEASASPDSAALPVTGYESDFYRFSTRSERWDRLSFDTYAEGGPKLIFDHQMLIDPETQLLYVFGGRVAHPDANKMELSGMWRYDVIQRSWTFLFDDNTHPQSRIPSRVGHTMLLDTPRRGSLAGKRILWVLAGQRGVHYLADMWTYQLNTGAVREVSRDYSLAANGGGPEGGFTQRATIDSETREIHLFSGLVRRSKSRGERVKSAFWVYHVDRHDWRLVYQHGGAGSAHRQQDSSDDDGGNEMAAGASADGDEEGARSSLNEPGRGPTQAFPIVSPGDLDGDGAGGGGDVLMSSMDALPVSGGTRRATPVEVEPRPRFAAQMGYDHKRRLFYIFGGNPAEGNPAVRLDDLWSLELVRPSVAEVLRKAKFKLRQQRFLEMAHDVDGGGGGGGGLAGMGAMQALLYLQTQVSQVVNHDVAEESQAFRKLMSHLLHAGSGGAAASGEGAAAAGRNASDIGFDGSSPFASPMHAHATSVVEPCATMSSPLPPSRADDHVAAADAQSDSDGDSDMLSASQVLPVARGGGAGTASSSLGVAGAATGDSATGAVSVLSSGGISVSARQLASEGQPSTLYRQRYQLFRTLCEYFPADAVEPNVDLQDCIEISKLSF